MTNEKDKSNSPTEPFNEAAYEMEVVFVSEIDAQLSNDAEEENLRGNTAPKHDPKNQKNKGYTPMGSGPSLGASSSRSQGQTPNNQHEMPVRGQPASKERQNELLNGDHNFEDIMNGLRVRTWLTDKPSDKGFRGGHIQELAVSKGDMGSEIELAHFKDGKWKIEAEMTPERDAFAQTVNKYDYDFIKAQLEKEQEERDQQRQMEQGKDNGKSR
jgi:hypothetical protein